MAALSSLSVLICKMGPLIAPIVTALSARFLWLLRLTMLAWYKIVGRLTILAIFKGQFSGVKHIDIIATNPTVHLQNVFIVRN